MKAFRLFLTGVLSLAIVFSTCGVVVFITYITFLPFRDPEYWTLLAIFTVVDICAVFLLAGLLHTMTAATAAIAAGALSHLLIYAPHLMPPLQSFAVSAAGDAIIIMAMMTATYLYAQKSAATGTGTRKLDPSVGDSISRPKPDGFWSSLDKGNKVAILTSLFGMVGTIVAALIGILPLLRNPR